MRLQYLLLVLFLPPYLFALEVITDPYKWLNYSEINVYTYPSEKTDDESECQEYDSWGECIEYYDCRNYDECE